MFIDIVLYTLYILLALALVATLWSVVRSVRVQVQEEQGARSVGQRVSARRIAWLTAGLLVVTLVVTWFIGSTKPLSVNGKIYDNAFWLKTSDMLILTSTVLIVVLVIAAVVGFIRSKRSV